MSITKRNDKLGRIDSIPLTAADAAFYRSRIDTLTATLDALIAHYHLNKDDYRAFIATHEPHANARADQHALLRYADGLILLMTLTISADITLSLADETFYLNTKATLDFEHNYPPRFINNIANIAA